ncbi:bifunctional DNA primase/polymerase [bacterium]|nr:bifunctional DNA primase/polymerase [bacterium]
MIYPSILEASYSYARLGWKICFCEVGTTPTKTDLENATTKAEEIKQLYEKSSNPNIVIATGKNSDLIAVKLPCDQVLKFFDTIYGKHVFSRFDDIPHKMITPKDEVVGYFRYPMNKTVESKELNKGIYVYSDGGYVFAPPSRDEVGRRFEWIN